MGMHIGNKPVNTSRRFLRNQLVSDINVTPLVDVMLVLLIIFMVTSPMIVTNMNIDLPKTKQVNNAPDKNSTPVTINIDNKGTVYIDDKEVSKEKIIETLDKKTKKQFDVRIYVRGDRQVTYGKVIAVFDQLNQAGYHKVALVTQIDSQ